jgi:hypothetical protein
VGDCDERPAVVRLTYSAIPLRYVDGCTNLRITAEGRDLGLLRGRVSKRRW